jgi:hypothetical protein
LCANSFREEEEEDEEQDEEDQEDEEDEGGIRVELASVRGKARGEGGGV